MRRHFVFTGFPTAGHVIPTLPLVEELTRRGHRITYATHRKWGPALGEAGARLLPIDFDVPPGPAATDTGPDRFAARLELFAGLISAGFPALLAHASCDPPDAVCYDMMTPIGRMLAERLELPGIALLPSFAGNRWTAGETTASSPTQAALRQVRTGLRALAAEHGTSMPSVLMSGPSPTLNIVFVPREFQLAGDTFGERFRFVGPCPAYRIRDEGWRAPEGDGPLLFVSLGTASSRPAFFRLCADAFAGTRWRLLMAIGEHADPADIGPMPPNVEIRPFFPQPAVLSHADVFLSHAGMNSVMESLSAGVPIVSVPQRPEQEANARRVEELGLGLRLEGSALSAELLRSAVREVSEDEGVKARLARMREIIHEAGGPHAAADAIETCLEETPK